jgi:sigma-E factor negative regulatory protein RseA
MDRMQTQELISALADGQLRGEAFARGVEVAAGDPAALETWHTYHLIGDVLRSGDFTAGMVPEAFLSRVQSRLQQEQGIGATATAAISSMPAAALPGGRPAANDASFRWKVVAGFASLTAIAAIGWTMTAGSAGKPQEPQLAATQRATVLAGTERGVMIRDPKLDEFLAAHRQLGGASALQMPSGFLRSATFEGPAR